MPATTDFMERVRDWLDNQDHEDRLKFKTYAENLMMKFVEKLEALPDKDAVPATAEKNDEKITPHNQNPEISQSKYILDNIPAEDFTHFTGLPVAYRKTLAAFEEIVEERNKVLYDTEFEFARLLLRRQFRDPVVAQEWNCEHWAKLLLWVSGYATLKDMAAVANDVRLPSIMWRDGDDSIE